MKNKYYKTFIFLTLIIIFSSFHLSYANNNNIYDVNNYTKTDNKNNILIDLSKPSINNYIEKITKHFKIYQLKDKSTAHIEKQIKINDKNNIAKENPRRSKEPEVKTITMSFAGDFTLGKDATTKVYNTFDRKYKDVGKDPSYFLKNVKSIFDKDDNSIATEYVE